MFAIEWIFTLFTSVISIEEVDAIFTEFFSKSWSFLYRFIIHLLKSHEEMLLLKDDTTEMVSAIKGFKLENKNEGFLASLPLFRSISKTTTWSDLINRAKKEKIDEKRMRLMIASYDIEDREFKCIPN